MRAMSNPKYCICIMVALALVLALPTGLMAGKPAKPPRLSPASLDLDTCGCPTTFDGDPACETQTSWSLFSSVGMPTSLVMDDPDAEAFLFDVTVTEDGPAGKILEGMGTLAITNSGGRDALVSSVVVLLEKVNTNGTGNAPGPSGKNWDILATAVATAYPNACGDTAAICDDGYELEIDQDEYGSSLDVGDMFAGGPAMIPPASNWDFDGQDFYYVDGMTPGGCNSVDNDSDGRYDEDPEADGIDEDNDGADGEDGPDDDGDGEIDEDKEYCTTKKTYDFTYTFNLTDLDLDGPNGPVLGGGDGIVPSDDDLRIEVVVTFGYAGERGGAASCIADINCDGDKTDDFEVMGRGKKSKANVRTVRQRHQFDPVECAVCDPVHLTDPGATVDDNGCVSITTNTLGESISAGQSEEGVYSYDLTGTVSCLWNRFEKLEEALETAEGDDGVVNMKIVTYPYPGADSYFDTELSNAGDLDGTYDGWCVDTGHVIYLGTTYTATLTSSYDPAATSLVDKWWNLDLVNWIINQHFPGEPSACHGGSIYTYGDVQRAIWVLIENTNSTSGLGSWSQCRVDEIVAAALANGNGFEPSCSQDVAIILNPINAAQLTVAQITMVSIPGVCPAEGGCSATVSHEATLTCDTDSWIDGSPATNSFTVYCNWEQ